MKRRWTNKKSVTMDGLDPMTRLLSQTDPDGFCFVEYDQQWKTVFRAERLGYLDDNQRLTEAGKEYLNKKIPA